MKIKLRTIIRLCALVLVILFFVPTTTVSCSFYGEKEKIDISPFGLATGIWNDNSEDMGSIAMENDAYPVLFAMMGLSIVLILLGSKIPILGVVITILNDLVLYLMHYGILLYVREEYGDNIFVKQTGAFGWYVTISIIIIILLLLKQFKIFQKLKQLRKTKTPEGDSSEAVPKNLICKYCGVESTKDNYYCGKCGTKL